MGLKGKSILITGGTGSFGGRVAKYLLKQRPTEIRIFSRDEKKQWDMKAAFPDFRYFLGDVRDKESLERAMVGTDYVFHAAALKQVPSCEHFPMEAVKTNVIGTHNACEVAKQVGVQKFVALSTDKAVKPVNAMGISKAMMEKVVCQQNLTPCGTVFSCVRYGNVMGSRGSVIPLFKKQIEAGHEITITAPEMTRFMMTLDESVDLVVHALNHSQGGEIFVRKSPACRVQLVAESLRLAFSPMKEKHPIKVVGIRPGEKVHEILVNEYEMQRSSEQETYYLIHPEYRHIPTPHKKASLGSEYTSENTVQLKRTSELLALLERVGEVEDYL